MGKGEAPKKKLLTKAAFAALAGVSGPAITRAVREGRVIATKAGLIDPENAVNVIFLAAHRGAASPKKGKSPSKQPAAGGSKVSLPPPRGGAASLVAQRIQADIILKTEQAATHRQRRLERLGLLLTKELMEKRLAIIGQEVKARFLDLPARVFPQLAALIKSGRDEEALAHLEKEISEAVIRVKEKAVKK